MSQAASTVAGYLTNIKGIPSEAANSQSLNYIKNISATYPHLSAAGVLGIAFPLANREVDFFLNLHNQEGSDDVDVNEALTKIRSEVINDSQDLLYDPSMMTPDIAKGAAHIQNSLKLTEEGKKRALEDMLHTYQNAPEEGRLSPVSMASEISKDPSYQHSVIPGEGVLSSFGTADVMPELLSEKIPSLNLVAPYKDLHNWYSGAGTTYTDAKGIPQKGGITDTHSFEAAKNMNTILVSEIRSTERALRAANNMMAKDPEKGAKMLEAATGKVRTLQKFVTKVGGEKALDKVTKGAPVLQALFVAKGLIAPSKSVMANIERFKQHDPGSFSQAAIRAMTAAFDPETQGAAMRQAGVDTVGLGVDIVRARTPEERGEMIAGAGEGSGVLDYGRRSTGKRSLWWSPEEIAAEEANKYYQSKKVPSYYSKFTPEHREQLAKYMEHGYMALPPQSHTAEGTKGYHPEGYFRVGGGRGDTRDLISPKDMPSRYEDAVETDRQWAERANQPGTSSVMHLPKALPYGDAEGPLEGPLQQILEEPTPKPFVPSVETDFQSALGQANKRIPTGLPKFKKL
jgi:hypothetical protein